YIRASFGSILPFLTLYKNTCVIFIKKYKNISKNKRASCWFVLSIALTPACVSSTSGPVFGQFSISEHYLKIPVFYS
ncbi:hypothetical protein, partial [Pseudomonas syringae]|uniref:hypothetical protein n=1 Tax=Pseudomonas syringae TaxID=317 RepID=UPI0034D51126